ncbi:CstA-like transporter-associated (seleno)protein [Erwinia sp.]|uniref:YbdD/YjiX family protein n=1 Tax=Erwinia citreus TaxID=558 RepID=UPI0028A05BF1|nr:CstA-like transporter-associated (seleno)protein [Erwinia sp.]
MARAIFSCPKKSRFSVLRCRPLAITVIKEPLTLRLLMSRLAQCFRLMVGVQDYQTYLRHMQLHHPADKAMTEKDFHRYCLEARFPSAAGKVGKCPC